MGTATASTTFFRQLGAAIGAAVFGSVLASRLNHYLTDVTGGALGGGPTSGINTNNIESIRALSGPVRDFVLAALTHSLNDVFLTGVPFAALALVVAFFIPEVPLASRRPGAATPPTAE
jgi:hypothetical protein